MDPSLEFKARCTKCGQWTAGKLHFTARMQVADSDGGMLFNNGWKCHNCLGEPWASADIAVTLAEPAITPKRALGSTFTKGAS